jgi:hypothetical protein
MSRIEDLPDYPVYVNFTGAEAVAAWLDRENAEKE